MEVLKIDQREKWEMTLDEGCQSDFYHTHAYHALSEDQGEGIAHFWVYREGDYMIALPLLVRSLEDVSGLEEVGKGWFDAASVYGYTGPVASHKDIPEIVVKNFQKALEESLRERRIISVFSRLHPLIPNGKIIAGLGNSICCGTTVAMDLTLTPDEQWKGIRMNHQRGIKKLRRAGYTFIHDEAGEYLSQFASIYTETMERVEAEEKYFFDDAYFEGLFKKGGRDVDLFFLASEGSPVCGGIFLERSGILEFHLGGTRDDQLHHSPMKLLVDEVRLWATSKGLRVLHLGGGKDSLFHFKTGFSERTFPFSTWQWVVNSEAYEAVCRCKAAFNSRLGLRVSSQNFFPPYRRIAEPLGKPLSSEGGEE